MIPTWIAPSNPRALLTKRYNFLCDCVVVALYVLFHHVCDYFSYMVWLYILLCLAHHATICLIFNLPDISTTSYMFTADGRDR